MRKVLHHQRKGIGQMLKKALISFVLFTCVTTSADARKITWEHAIAVKATAPQWLALSYSGVWFDQPSQRQMVMQIEPGISGGKFSLGFIGDRSGMTYHDWDALKLSVLYTWGDPADAPPKQTYVGLEYEETDRSVSFHLGVYGHVGGGDKSREIIVSGGIGYYWQW